MLRERRLTTLLIIVVLLNPNRIDSDGTSRGTPGKLLQLASKPHAVVCKGIEENLKSLWF